MLLHKSIKHKMKKNLIDLENIYSGVSIIFKQQNKSKFLKSWDQQSEIDSNEKSCHCFYICHKHPPVDMPRIRPRELNFYVL